MILSQPANYHETRDRAANYWTSSTLPLRHKFASLQRSRKPAPDQPAPQKPTGGFRSQTLDRLQLKQNKSRQILKPSNGVINSKIQAQPDKTSSFGFVRGLNQTEPVYSKPETIEQIYAPASIASPQEFRTRRLHSNDQSEHYAATSYRTHSESGRESTLGSLFGSLRRKARRTYGSLRRPDRRASKGESKVSRESPIYGIAAIEEPTYLDPKIYGTGKREVKAEQIYAEGLSAIDGNCRKRPIEQLIDKSLMQEGESRVLVVEPEQPDYLELINLLKNWINDELSTQRIIVGDLQDDLYDGQVFGKLIEKLHGIELDIVEVTQNEQIQKRKLHSVLTTINRIFKLQARWARIRWSVDGIHSKSIVEIIHLLVALAIYHRAPVRLPSKVRIRVVEVKKVRGELESRSHVAQLTDVYETSLDDAGYSKSPSNEQDPFRLLVESSPEKLATVKRALSRFANRHLSKVNLSCQSQQSSDSNFGDDLNPELFSDGILLIFLIASLEDFFVPLGNFFTRSPERNGSTKDDNLFDLNNNSTRLPKTAIKPESYTCTQSIDMLHNVNFALQLMEEGGLDVRESVRAEDIVNGDLASVLRILYMLFSRYRHL